MWRIFWGRRGAPSTAGQFGRAGNRHWWFSPNTSRVQRDLLDSTHSHQTLLSQCCECNPRRNNISLTVGVLGTSLDAIHLVFSSVLATKPWLRDPSLVPISWRQDIVEQTLARATSNGIVNDQRPLKLGIYWTDNVVTPHPPVARGLRTVVERVKQAGHKVIEWNPPDQRNAKRVHLAFLKADGGHDIHKQLRLSGEPLIPPLRETFRLRDPLSLIRYQELTVEGLDYERTYSDYWNSTGDEDDQPVDAVIMPVAPHAAVIPGKYFHTVTGVDHMPQNYANSDLAYTEAIKLLDYSATVIPVTKADQKIDKANPDYQPLNEVDARNWNACKC